MFNKKGQAALEFLMTYGWAILAAVVVIGALAYFGVFSPGRYAPSACTLSAPLGCEEHNIQENGPRMVIRNGGGESINITDVQVEDCDSYEHNLTVDGDGTEEIPDGSKGTIVNSEDCDLSSEDRFNSDVTVTYKTGDLEQTSSGQVSGTVQ